MFWPLGTNEVSKYLYTVYPNRKCSTKVTGNVGKFYKIRKGQFVSSQVFQCISVLVVVVVFFFGSFEMIICNWPREDEHRSGNWLPFQFPRDARVLCRCSWCWSDAVNKCISRSCVVFQWRLAVLTCALSVRRSSSTSRPWLMTKVRLRRSSHSWRKSATSCPSRWRQRLSNCQLMPNVVWCLWPSNWKQQSAAVNCMLCCPSSVCISC